MLLRAPRFAFFIVLISLLALVPAESVPAYTLTGGQWPQPGGLGTPVTVTYSYQNLLDGGLHGPGAADASGIYHPDGPSLSANSIRRSVQAALSLWAAVVPINFVEVPDSHDPAVEGADYSTGQFGQIRMRHVFINGTDPAPGPGQTATDVAIAKAQTYFPGSNINLAGDIEFDDGDPWQLNGTIQVPDIFGAATHELGHALGLNHSTDPTAVMFPVFQRFNGPGTGHLGADDIAGIQSIYGAGHGSVTPLAVPEPWSAALAAIGVTMLALRRWNRR